EIVEDTLGLLAVERFPQRFRNLETWQMIEAVRQVANDVRQQLLPVRDKDHVRIGRQDPAIVRIRAAHSDVARHRLQSDEMCTVAEARMMLGPYSENAETAARRVGERVANRFWKRWIIVWRIVIDEEDFVVIVMQDFRHAIETEGSALVQVVTVIVISSVQDE